MTSRLTIQTYPNEAAAAYIRGKAVADPENFGNLPDQLKQRAFAVAGIERLDAVRRIRDLVAKLPEGASWDEAKREIAAEMSPYTGGDMKAARARAEFTLRMQGFQAYAVARHQQQMAGAKSHPYWKYETVGDSRVRAGHAKLDGKVLRADDPWWKTHYPPWDWGCRCIVIALDEEDAKEIGISEHSDMPNPERSGTFAFDPTNVAIDIEKFQADQRFKDEADWKLNFVNPAKNVKVQRANGTECTMWDLCIETKYVPVAKDLAKQSWKDGKERGIVIDFDTGKKIGDVFVGDSDEVKLTIPSGKNVATLHTHTNGDNTPSPGDILDGFRIGSKAEYVASGKKLRRWVWLKTPEPEDARLIREYEEANKNGGVDMELYNWFLRRLIDNGYIKMEKLS